MFGERPQQINGSSFALSPLLFSQRRDDAGGVTLRSCALTKNAPANVGLLDTNPVQRLQSFHPDFRDDIQKFVTKFSAAHDLAEAFPGLLFALSTGAAKPSQRNKAKRALASGAP